MRWYAKYDEDETTQGPFSEKVLIERGRPMHQVRPVVGGPWVSAEQAPFAVALRDAVERKRTRSRRAAYAVALLSVVVAALTAVALIH